jgi:tetratricopeptide (TPR) repeat protein
LWSIGFFWFNLYFFILRQEYKTNRLSRAYGILKQVINDLPQPSLAKYRLTWKTFPLLIALLVLAVVAGVFSPLLGDIAALSFVDFLDFLLNIIPIIVTFLVLLSISYLVWFYSTRTMVPRRVVYGESVQRGDYNKSLRQIDNWRRLWPKYLYNFYRGLVLKEAGRYQEAESQLIESLKAGLNSNAVFLETVLNQLGYMMLSQQRYDQALQYFEAAVQIRPESSNTYASLADTYLYQGIQPERAMELIEHGVARLNKRYPLQGAIGGTRAWALALLGRETEARASLEQALRQKPPMDAEFNFIAGEVTRLLGNKTEAVSFFSRVLEIESQGMFRNRAERALHTMSEIS